MSPTKTKEHPAELQLFRMEEKRAGSASSASAVSTICKFVDASYSENVCVRSSILHLLCPDEFKYDATILQIEITLEKWETLKHQNTLKLSTAPGPSAMVAPISVADSPASTPAPRATKAAKTSLETAMFEKSFTSAQLQPSRDDHGYGIDRFIRDMEVIVYFQSGPIGGNVTSKNKRAGTVTVNLDLKNPTTVIVPCSAVTPMDDAGTDDDFDE
jgi:hypothetical protein